MTISPYIMPNKWSSAMVHYVLPSMAVETWGDDNCIYVFDQRGQLKNNEGDGDGQFNTIWYIHQGRLMCYMLLTW